jgi:hypothetical protein
MLLLAHRVISLLRSSSAALGAKRTSELRLMLNSLSANCIGCFWGKADIKWQAMPVDPVENDPKQT